MATVVPLNPLPPDKSLGGVLLTLTCVLTSFTILTTLSRLWARYGSRALGWDDYAILVCCLLAVVRTSIQILSVHHGNGRHRWYISQTNYEYVNFLTWLTQILLFTNIGLMKCSICLLILRIRNDRVLRNCLYTMMVGLVLTNLEPIVVLLAECNPPSKYWRPSTPGKCWPTKVRIYSIYVQVAYSVVTDLICALLPIIVLWNVKITLRAKIGICGLMSLGLIATAVAIVRASSLGIKTADLSYDYAIAAIWANTELHLGIIATNLALSRMIWGFFRGGTKPILSNNTPRNGTGSHMSRTRPGHGKSSHRRVYKDACLETRGSFDAQSYASQISLDPIMKKETNVGVSPSALKTPAVSKETLSYWDCERESSEHDEIQPSLGLQH